MPNPKKSKEISNVALIPARAGSKRIEDKNIRQINGHPLMAYTIQSAIDSGIFDSIILSTDSEKYAEIGAHYGAEILSLRPVQYAGACSPDIEWVKFTLQELKNQNRIFDCVSILRPTSPFRTPETIQRAWKEFMAESGVDSIRAIELCSQHPGKMWTVSGKRIMPIFPFKEKSTPWHSNQYAALPKVYVQNASLEIVYSDAIQRTGEISGDVVMPFFTKGFEGFDINYPNDWWLMERIIKAGDGELPKISTASFFAD